MKLEDLLDELRNNILHDRSAQTGGTNPDYLWSDKTLVRYINEAQKRFARRALVIRDGSTAEVVNVTLVEGQSEYNLHSSILSVITAKISTAQVDLVRTGHWALGTYQPPNAVMWDSSHFVTMQPGTPLAFATDEELVEGDDGSRNTVTMRVFPTPDAAAAGTLIKLRVCRLPIDDLAANDLCAEPEIPSDYHIPMLDWAAYLALRIVDHDAGDPARAQEFANSFEAHVREARAEVLKKLFAPQSWGFGKSGWSW
jgi:hypothetical protein